MCHYTSVCRTCSQGGLVASVLCGQEANGVLLGCYLPERQSKTQDSCDSTVVKSGS